MGRRNLHTKIGSFELAEVKQLPNFVEQTSIIFQSIKSNSNKCASLQHSGAFHLEEESTKTCIVSSFRFFNFFIFLQLFSGNTLTVSVCWQKIANDY